MALGQLLRVQKGMCLWSAFCLSSTLLAFAADGPPKVGDTAADFELQTIDGKTVKLLDETQQGPVVLVVLRGYPGYQCPACSQQVGQFVAKAAEFRQAKARVLLVYPGPEAKLQLKAQEFLGKQQLPAGFQFLLDPDYKFTNAYRLRWDAPNETAYPATFVIQPDQNITFANISQTHGGRVNPAVVLKALQPDAR